MEGRVEVCHNQIWWAVSGYSYYWDFNDATVVCRHLHYPANCKLHYKIHKYYQLLLTYICVNYKSPFPPPTLNIDFRYTDA